MVHPRKVALKVGVKNRVHLDGVEMMRRDTAIEDSFGDHTGASPQFDHWPLGRIKPRGHFRAKRRRGGGQGHNLSGAAQNLAHEECEISHAALRLIQFAPWLSSKRMIHRSN
jgi:hypothetical protein